MFKLVQTNPIVLVILSHCVLFVTIDDSYGLRLQKKMEKRKKEKKKTKFVLEGF